MSDLTIQPTGVQQQKKMSPVKKGALIGFGADLAARGIAVGLGIKAAGKDAFVHSLKDGVNTLGKGKTAAIIATSLALSTAIGAGIGKIVENFQNKKAQKTQAEV